MQQKNNKVRLTIFTPAYNRAHTLHRCYESLQRQTCKEFKWLIIDDGSADHTSELVQLWLKEENDFEIQYEYKMNGGMHTAHNRAYELITTELNVCIDSDDYMPDNAVELIMKCWNECGSEKYAGIVGLDATFDGKIIGRGFPKKMKTTTLSGYYAQGGLGDKKLVYRTDLMKKYPPYPVFEGEKYVSLGYKYLLCDQEYELLVLNRILCKVEYQNDGSSKNMLYQYLNNPKGFAFLRKIDMKYNTSLKRQVVTCMHYVSSSILSKNRYFIQESPKKVLTIISIPGGVLLTIYIKWKTKRRQK